MFGFPLLDVFTGLVFIYALLALVCTAANEIYAGMSDRRENHLNEGISNLLGEQAMNGAVRQKVAYASPGTTAKQGVVEAFYAHPLIKSLNEKGTRPSYIPDTVFARVILDMFAPTGGTAKLSADKFNDFVTGVTTALPADSDLRRTLLIHAEDAAGDLEKLNTILVAWFNDAMKRVTGWYKNQSQSSLLLISFLICLALNADSIRIVKELYDSPAKRNMIVTQAEQASKAFANVSGHSGSVSIARSAESLTTSLGKLEATGLSLGWQGYEFRPECFGGRMLVDSLLMLLGILFTALAVTLGAPFWFDMLGKLINLRAIGKPPVDTETKPPAPATTEAKTKQPVLPANKAAVNLDEKSVG
ncbi:MAG: hypothetical protein HGB32_15055 [Geobacteraceae bacterium]|nr:hypothetical protein [Geobacteraceae bacterium]NTW81442.1 hypothetical protein [Geobacteraceae bacterium]